MFLSDPFQKLFAKFRNEHGISEWGLLALYGHNKEILVNSSLKATKSKLARVISKIQVSDPGPSWPSCFIFHIVSYSFESQLLATSPFSPLP